MHDLYSFNLASGGLPMSSSGYHSVTFSGTKNADTFHLLVFSVLQKSSKVCASLAGEPGPARGCTGVSWLLSFKLEMGDRKASVPRNPTGSCSVSLSRVLERGERKICSSER